MFGAVRLRREAECKRGESERAEDIIGPSGKLEGLKMVELLVSGSL